MDLQEVPISFDRDKFLLNLLRELSGSLENVVGLEEASGFISIVGQYLGEWMEAAYKKQLSEQEIQDIGLAQLLIDLKRRIGGDFYVMNEDEQKIVLGNRVCPFGHYVEGRTSLCMMTSNVFGTIASDHFGYAKVCMRQTIAQGHKECKVIIYKNTSAGAEEEFGREYYKTQF